MKLTWHIIRKDLYAIRWMLLGWVLLALVPVASGIWARGGSDDVVLFAAEIQLINGIVMGLQVIMALFITAIMVHEDQLIGNAAQWQTLPLTGGRLLAAKLGGLLLVVWALPLLVLLPWWLANHFGPADILRIGLQYSAQTFLVVLPALLVAAMTDGWTRFIAWLLIFLVIVYVGAGAATVGVGTRLAVNATTGERMLESVSYSRAVMVFMILLVSTVTAVVSQYLRRRLVVSGIVLGTGFVLAVLVAGTWRWNVVPDLRRLWTVSGVPEPAQQATVAMDWSVMSARVAHLTTTRGLRHTLSIFNTVRFDSLGFGEGGYGRTRSIRLIWPDGTSYVFDGIETRDGTGQLAASSWMERRTAEAVTDPLDLPNDFLVRTGGLLPLDVAERIVREPPTVRISFEVGVHKTELLAEVPIKAGERFGQDAWQFTVVASERTGPFEQRVRVMERRPAAWFQPYLVGPRLPTWSGPILASQKWGHTTFSRTVVSIIGYFNRSERPIVASVGRWGNNASESRLIGSFAGVEVTRHRHTVSSMRSYPAPGATVVLEGLELSSPRPLVPLRPRPGPQDEHWLDEAMLVWTMTKAVARMESSIDIELLEVEEVRLPPVQQAQ